VSPDLGNIAPPKASPSLAQQQACSLNMLGVGAGDPRASFPGLLLHLGGSADRQDSDQARLCLGLSKGHSQAMRGRLGATNVCMRARLGLCAGLPVWGGLGVCLGLFVNVWACLCLSASIWSMCLCVVLSGVSTSACESVPP
jgi:hypothetical protein